MWISALIYYNILKLPVIVSPISIFYLPLCKPQIYFVDTPAPFKLAFMHTSYQLFSPVSTGSIPVSHQPCRPAPLSLRPVSKRLCCAATLLPAFSSAALLQVMLTSPAPGLWSGSPIPRFRPCPPTSSPASRPTFRGVSFSDIFEHLIP